MKILLQEIQGAIDATLRKYGVAVNPTITTNVLKIDYTIEGSLARVEFHTTEGREIEDLAARVEELIDERDELARELHSLMVSGCKGHECSGECGSHGEGDRT